MDAIDWNLAADEENEEGDGRPEDLFAEWDLREKVRRGGGAHAGENDKVENKRYCYLKENANKIFASEDAG